MKQRIKDLLWNSGWYLKRKKNLPTGVNWALDVERIYGDSSKVQTLLDVGANLGQTAEVMRRAFPKAVIHSFEPDPESFAALEARARILGNVHCHKLAVSDHVGIEQSSFVPRSPMNSLATSRYASHSEAIAVELSLTTLDEFCTRQGITRVSVLKTDTEGYDAKVLAGARGLLSSNAIEFVLCEVTFDFDDVMHSQFSDLAAALRSHKYALCALYETETLQRRGRGGTYCNAMFARSSLLPDAPE